MAPTSKDEATDLRTNTTDQGDDADIEDLKLTAEEESELDQYLTPVETRTPSKPKVAREALPPTPKSKKASDASEASLPTPGSSKGSPAKDKPKAKPSGEITSGTPKKQHGYFGSEAREIRSPGKHTPYRAYWKS